MTDERLFLGAIVVSKQRASHFYMEIHLVTETNNHQNIDVIKLKKLIAIALKTLFGDSGAVINVDILCYDFHTGKGIIKVPSSGVVQVWSSLTWFFYYQEERYKFNINKVSPYLVSLSRHSRQYEHKKIDT